WYRVELGGLELGVGADEDEAVVARARADEVRVQLRGVAPHARPGEHEERRDARALRHDLELDPAVALAPDAIGRHAPIARDRADQVVGAGHHHGVRSLARLGTRGVALEKSERRPAGTAEMARGRAWRSTARGRGGRRRGAAPPRAGAAPRRRR